MKHIGTKIINATPMTRQQYNDLRGWTVPSDENPGDEGYLVEYLDGSSANHPKYTGYISWYLKDVFERTYHSANAMTFGDALVMLKEDKRVCRSGWNGKGMWLFKIQGCNDIASLHGYGFGEYLGEPTFSDAVYMKTADNMLVPWLCSQTDMLAEDWMLIED